MWTRPSNIVSAAAPTAPALAPIKSPTHLDVLSGRGRKVQGHDGNVKFRKLVFANRDLYAKSKGIDRVEICKGIASAIRKVGGRFLEFDERTGTYSDIGDVRAIQKTRQAIREGLKLRGQLTPKDLGRPAPEARRKVSAQGCFAYSVQFLLALRDCNVSEPPPAAREEKARPHPFLSRNTERTAPRNPLEAVPLANAFEVDAVMAAEFDLFPGSLAEPPPPAERVAGGSPGWNVDADLFTPETVGQLLEATRDSDSSKNGAQGAADAAPDQLPCAEPAAPPHPPAPATHDGPSEENGPPRSLFAGMSRGRPADETDGRPSSDRASGEISDLIRMAESGLHQVHNMSLDKIIEGGATWEDEDMAHAD